MCLRYAPPIVTSWSSEKMFLSKRRRMEDLPTPESPRKTTLDWRAEEDFDALVVRGFFGGGEEEEQPIRVF